MRRILERLEVSLHWLRYIQIRDFHIGQKGNKVGLPIHAGLGENRFNHRDYRRWSNARATVDYSPFRVKPVYGHYVIKRRIPESGKTSRYI